MALSGCKQGTSEGVMEYYGHLSKVWKEYIQYARVPRCICAGCTCNIAKQVGDIHDEDRLHYFLIGLDDHYEAIRAQLLARSLFPGLDEAYQTVMNTETMRAKATRGPESVMAFKVETKPRSRSGDASDRFCGHCNREGHEEETCYQLIGFPEWWDEKKRGGRGPGRGGRASVRGGRGARGAASWTSGVARANAVSNATGGATTPVTSGGGSQGAVTTTNHELVGVTKEQVQQIVDILSRPPKKLQGNLDLRWIVDSGASRHVTGDISILRNIKTSRNQQVVLPDGQPANSNQYGSFNRSLRVVRSDNGTEFNCLQGYFLKNGILFESSCVGTPQQNGRVERKHQHMLNVGRALRFQGNLPIKFLGKCIMAACHLINRTPTPVLGNKTPYEMLFGKPPSYVSIRVFGCLCYAYNLRSKGDKFASRGRKCVFLGYPFGRKGWQLYDLETHEFFVSRDWGLDESGTGCTQEVSLAGDNEEVSSPAGATEEVSSPAGDTEEVLSTVREEEQHDTPSRVESNVVSGVDETTGSDESETRQGSSGGRVGL
ncbi:uncharacterized protein [Spinacia oleracea]|uniref:Integrase catalytic domain-containing protein n=1 Tax=Spinacia oleracea TaxID=3562 RepID=A0ABM3RQY3_SPIOL|nr:uncharacterized protein LOC130471761 [Spinacia oleracea]